MTEPTSIRPHDNVTTHPEYRRVYDHYLQHGASPEEAARQSYDHTEKFLTLNPAPKKRSGRTLAVVVLSAVALMAAFALGTVTAASEPKTITKTEQVTVPRDVIKTEMVTPAACAEAIQLAEKVIGLASDAQLAASEAFDAASRYDAAGIDAATAKMDAIKPQINAITPKYQAARDKCLASR